MSSETTEHETVSGRMMSPGRLLRILFSHVKPYSLRAVVLVVTLVVEGAFNILNRRRARRAALGRPAPACSYRAGAHTQPLSNHSGRGDLRA